MCPGTLTRFGDNVKVWCDGTVTRSSVAIQATRFMHQDRLHMHFINRETKLNAVTRQVIKTGYIIFKYQDQFLTAIR